MTNKQDILSAFAQRTESVETRGGTTVTIRSMSVADRIVMYRLMQTGDDDRRFHAIIFLLSVCTPAGERIFDESDLADIEKMEFGPVDRVVSAAMELSGIGASARDDYEKK